MTQKIQEENEDCELGEGRQKVKELNILRKKIIKKKLHLNRGNR